MLCLPEGCGCVCVYLRVVLCLCLPEGCVVFVFT